MSEHVPPYAAPAPPREVQTAFRLFLAYIVIGVIGAAASLTLLPQAVDAALRQQQLPPGTSPEFLASAARIGVIVGVVIGLIIIVLQLVVVFQMRKGRNWARIVLTVLGALGVISFLVGIANMGQTMALGGVGVVSSLLSIVNVVLVVAAIYFMFRPNANAWFTAPRF